MIEKLIEALFDEEEAFWLYKDIVCCCTDMAKREKIISFMTEELNHYKELHAMIFTANQSAETAIEKAFKNGTADTYKEMKTCLDMLRMSK